MAASATIRDPQTFNRYSYALNSPYKFSDPLGLLPVSWSGGSAGCSAEFSSCDENGMPSDPFEAEAYRQYQTAVDQLHAFHALSRGDMHTFWEILHNNSDLQALDANGNVVQEPNEPSGSVTAEANVSGTFIVADGESGTGNINVGENFYRAAMTAKQDLEAAGENVLYFGTVSSINGFQGLLDMAAKYGATTIAIFTHGSPDNVDLGNGARNDINAITMNNVTGLVNRSSSLASIFIYGCDAGRKDNGIAAALAKQLKVTVHAATGGMQFSDNPTKLSNRKIHLNSGPTYMVHVDGQWRRFPPP